MWLIAFRVLPKLAPVAQFSFMSTLTKGKTTARKVAVRRSPKKSDYRLVREADGLVVTKGPVRVTSEQIRALAAENP